MLKSFKPQTPEQNAAAAEYRASVAPAAVELKEDSLEFPLVIMLPLAVRSGPQPVGMSNRPWAALSADLFVRRGNPGLYSVTVQRQVPDTTRGSIRTRRTLFEGLLGAMAQKTGRRPTMAEQAADHAMDAAESRLAMGAPIYKTFVLSALVQPRGVQDFDSIRRVLESELRTKGLTPQRLHYITERAMMNLQPGGDLFIGMDAPTLMVEETLPLLPAPAKTVSPAADSVYLGRHARDGRDIFYSFTKGFDPAETPPPHATTLILGEMGSGKTSLMRWIMLQRVLMGRTVVSLDPEGENSKLCYVMGGTVIPAGVPEDTETCLLKPLVASTPSEMLMAARFVLSALGADLTAVTTAVVHDAVRRRWERRPGPMSLIDFSESLATLNTPEASPLVSLLRPFASGGLWEGFFDRPNALLSVSQFQPGQWWNFDLSALREENKAIVHAILTWFLYNAVTIGTSPIDIFIDEGWRLLRSDVFADMLDELGRRARKRGIGVTMITHLPADLARNAGSLGMASTAFIGRLGPEEAYHFFRSMGVPDADSRRNAETVSRLPPRTFLAAPAGGRGSLFPINVTIPRDWLELWGSFGAAR